MKKILKSIVFVILAILARLVIRRYKPHIVMVTGSVGKTSAKDAVAAVLSNAFYIRKSQKSFNSDFGVPFTILDVNNPWANPIAWFLVIKNAFSLLLLPNHYPKMLVLEIGSDKPGDISRLLRIVTPDVVVVTLLPDVPVHVEAYVSPEEVRLEEFAPAYALGAGAPLIIPADDSNAIALSLGTPARSITYGFSPNAFLRIKEPQYHKHNDSVIGMTAIVESVDGEREVVTVLGSVGRTQLLSAGAALATGIALNIKLKDGVTALREFDPPPGRGRLISGVNGSLIIDDSYNSSPVAVEEALRTLKEFPVKNGGRRIAVLGDMLELGRYSVMEHERIGKIAKESADIVVAVGIRSRVFQNAPGAAEVLLFDNSRTAALALPDKVQAGDVVLVKGSQSIRTERIVEALLANSADSSLLVRQEKQWKRRA